jgi:hypothetical protein
MDKTSESRETCEKSGTGKTDDGSRFSELRVAPVAHVLPVTLTLHERRFTRKNNGSTIAAEAFMNTVG